MRMRGYARLQTRSLRLTSRTSISPPPTPVSLRWIPYGKSINGAINDMKETSPFCIFGRDLYITNWELLYEEWIQAEGVINLVDPCVPAVSSGSALDKFVVAPGRCIPSTLLPTGGPEWRGGMPEADARFFPASVLIYTRLSDHLPIILPIVCEEENRSRDRTNRLRIRGRTTEDWGQRDNRLLIVLEEARPLSRLQRPVTNIPRLLGVTTRSLNRVFHRERRTPKLVPLNTSFLRASSTQRWQHSLRH